MTTKTAAFYKLIWVMQLYEVFNSAQKLGGESKGVRGFGLKALPKWATKKIFVIICDIFTLSEKL